ncbi:MAG: hypothetical protein KJ899_05655 [Gammaproteobacteria bacterium]|nr:hypothetical protein [Gammaproteobacteria bacterium]
MNFDHFLARSEGVDDTRQTGLGISWQANELISANYRYSDTNDGKVKVTGNEGGLSFAMDTLWQGELRTTLDLGYGEFGYKAANPKTLLAANLRLTQSRNSLGISQDISSSFAVYGTHERYKYDKDLSVQRLQSYDLLRIYPRLASAATTLLSYPDKSNVLGLTWKVTDALSLDISSAKTTTLMEQELKNTRVGMDYQAGKSLNLGIAVTRSSANAVVNSGVTVLPEMRDTYAEVTLGVTF